MAKQFEREEFYKICFYVHHALCDVNVIDSEFSIQPSDVFNVIENDLFEWIYDFCTDDGEFNTTSGYNLYRALPEYIKNKIELEILGTISYKDVNTIRTVVWLSEAFEVYIDFEVTVNDTICLILDEITEEAHTTINEYINNFYTALFEEIQAYNDEDDATDLPPYYETCTQ